MSLLSLVRRVSVTATRRMYATSTEAPPQRTALYDWHVRHGGKMVPFAGWEMPVQYKDSIMESHLHARASAALFDVSHMCQLFFHGADRESFLERVTVGNVKAMKEGTGCYSLITNTKGGVIDDTVFSKHADRVYMVVNAGCAEKDVAHLREQLADFTKNGAKDVRMERLSHLSLVALQGPKAAAVVARLTDTDLKHFAFLDSRPAVVAGIPAILTRCGYTGEDGFEISVATDKIEQLADALVSQPEVRPAGLGPRDSLRLEAALPLYGHDLNEDITPIEAGLAWAIAKRRRQEGGFLGADVILAQLNNGVARKRVGLVLDSGVCRENAPILSESGENIGLVTSGGFAPSLKKAIAMGYVKTAHSEIGTRLKVSVRDRQYSATVTKMPFVATSYYKPPK